MTSKDRSTEASLMAYLKKAVSQQKKANTLAKKNNQLSKQKLKQSQLNLEQAERLYLLEKSRLQPSFALSVTEFLLTEPDFMNDPEQASEAKFLSSHKMQAEDRVLRFQLTVKNKADYLCPSLVITRDGVTADDDLALSLDDLLYFLPYKQVSTHNNLELFTAYFIYRDQTTLPVVHKYQISKRHSSTLSRWNATHMDTAYVMSHHTLSSLSDSDGCAALFTERDY